KCHHIALLLQRSAIPRAMKSYKGSIAVLFRKLIIGIKDQVIGSPVTRKCHDWLVKFAAAAGLLPVAPILRSKNSLALKLILVTVRPSKIRAFGYKLKFFGGQFGTLLLSKQVRPQLM